MHFLQGEIMYIKLMILGILAAFSLYRAHGSENLMTLFTAGIVTVIFVLSLFHVWRKKD